MSADEHNLPDAKEEFLKCYADFAKVMLDYWAVVDLQGKIVKCHQQMHLLTGATSKEMLKGDSLDKFITIEYEGGIFSIKDFLKLNECTRIDEVTAASFRHIGLKLTLSFFPFRTAEGVTFGGFLLIRDVTEDSALQGRYAAKKQVSITDKLTGLFNRTHLEETLPQLVIQASQASSSSPSSHICVVMFDIDKFKAINDCYGHQAGDSIIAKIANLIRISFRRSDVICRYGGEEFLAILTGSALEEAGRAAEKVRQKIQEEIYLWKEESIPNSISVGLAQINYQNERTEESIARADQALYKAKNSGRNRVMIHRGGDVIEQLTLEKDITVSVEKHRTLALSKRTA